jgi:ribonucleoside-diphosphate reductase alpha chain
MGANQERSYIMQKDVLSFAGHALANRRSVVAMPDTILGSLRWPDRPVLPEGNPCWTYMVENGPVQYAVAVGHVENGRSHPFEVWVLANEQPRCLGATAKTLSADMRTQDRAWLKMKLDALAAVTDSLGIELQLGLTMQQTSSNSAALARVVQYRLDQLGVANPEAGEATPLVDAMFAMKDSDLDDTLSWNANIKNPTTGDDFTVFMPEVEVDGVHRPIAVRLSGRYPRDLDGLAALLTLDMAVVDVAWIGMKLRKLLDYEEPMGSFFAKNPGTGVSERFPSIVAYMTHRIIHRFATLGLLTQAGYPVVDMGVMVNVSGDAMNVLPNAA